MCLYWHEWLLPCDLKGPLFCFPHVCCLIHHMNRCGHYSRLRIDGVVGNESTSEFSGLYAELCVLRTGLKKLLTFTDDICTHGFI